MPTLPTGITGGTLSPVGIALSRSVGSAVSRTGDGRSRESINALRLGGGAGDAAGPGCGGAVGA